MSDANLPDRIQALRARLEPLRARRVANAGAPAIVRTISTSTEEHSKRIDALTPERIADLRREVAGVFAELGTHGVECSGYGVSALAGDDESAIEQLCKLVQVAADMARSIP